jgi:F-type H+-transporting ATPase subunit b
MNQAFYENVAIWSQVISSILFLCVLVWLWMKYLQPAIMASQERVNKQIAEGERHRDEAKAMLDILQTEIEGANRDAEAIKQRAADQAQHETDATLAEAREAGQRALANANMEFDRSLAAARASLRVEMLDKALTRARAQAQQRVDASTDTTLVDRFIGSLEGGTRNG